MELQKQLTNVEVSNKLKDLEFRVPSIFFREWRGAKEDEIEEQTQPAYYLDGVNCYTTSELGELLWLKASPDDILKAYGFVFNVHDTSVITPEGLAICMENPNIAAKMFIYLIEQKLITV